MNGGYQVSISRSAQKALAAIPSPDLERLTDSLRALSSDPRPAGCTKLTGRPGWRVRVGRYRIIYEIDDTDRLVAVLDIGHRRDIYR